MINIQKIYEPIKGKPMNVVVFASGGGNNFLTAIKIAQNSQGKIKVCLLVTDRLNIPAIDIAQKYGIPVIAKDFEKICGVWKECKNDPVKSAGYRQAAENFHNDILEEILEYQQKTGELIDLVVLSYHRLIQGKLLQYFSNRMINQHPGDLSIMQQNNPTQRKYIGLSPVYEALNDGNKKTRTVNFLVRAGCDNGEILSSGPWVHYNDTYPVTHGSAIRHENVQKKLSDRPCLRQVLIGISNGRYGIHKIKKHADGCHVVYFDDKPLPYQGYDLSIQEPIVF